MGGWGGGWGWALGGGGGGQVAVRPCSMKVTASLTVSAILSRTITTAKRRLWRASRGCPTAVRQQGALGCHQRPGHDGGAYRQNADTVTLSQSVSFS